MSLFQKPVGTRFDGTGSGKKQFQNRSFGTVPEGFKFEILNPSGLIAI
jgi:hypothetical protein